MNKRRHDGKRSRSLNARLLTGAMALLLAVSPLTAYADVTGEPQQGEVLADEEDQQTAKDGNPSEEKNKSEDENASADENTFKDENKSEGENRSEGENKSVDENASENNETADGQNEAKADNLTGFEEDEDANAGIMMILEDGDAAPVADEEYTVWFDGTLGLSHDSRQNLTADNLQDVVWYRGATNTKATTTDHKVTLPDSAGNTTQYGYTLQGWYDITSGRYYQKGTEVTITKDSVFYADWMPDSYDFGFGTNTVDDQPDTSSFITTDVYDYNELFNLRNIALSSSTISAEDHAEKWYIEKDNSLSVDIDRDGNPETVSTLNFAFLNWAYNQITKITNNDSQESIAYMNNRDTRNENRADLTQGIITGMGDNVLAEVFGTSDSLGRKYLGKGDNLYQYVATKGDANEGYYYYDSSKNAASYNQSAQRFYVYKDTDSIIGQDIKAYSSGWMYYEKDGNNSSAFLPFNDNSSHQYNEKDGSINYWFGMKSAVQFWLPNVPGSSDTANTATTGMQMEFRFSGDDDVWVFVDDELVLDLGGIHGKKDGSINFSTGKVVTDGATTSLSGNIKDGDHTLTIYYLERGSSQSNCSIYFNIAPRYSLTIDKKDSQNTGKVLQGAEFKIYKDEACTEAAQLWDNARDCNDKKPSKNTFITNDKGQANCYGLVANNTYYIKETKAPSGYPDVSNEVITLKVNADGTMVTKATKDGFLVDTTTDQGSRHFSITVRNESTPEEPETPDTPNPPHDGGYGRLEIYKVDEETSQPLAGATFMLYRSNGDYVGTYTTDENGYIGLPSIDFSTYYLVEVTAPEGYVLDSTQHHFVLDKDHAIVAIKVTNRKGDTPPAAEEPQEPVPNDAAGAENDAGIDENGNAIIATGDNSLMMVYGVMAVMAAALLLVWAYRNGNHHRI